MAKPILDDELWALIEPLLPTPKPRRSRYPGRKPLDDRAVLTGILFILQTCLRWDLLPRETSCGSGMSCWRRLRDWQTAGVWDRLHEVLLARLRQADRIDWSRVVVGITASGMPCASVMRWCFEPGRARSVGFGPVLDLHPPRGSRRNRLIVIKG